MGGSELMMGCRCLAGTLQRQYPFLEYRLSVDLALGDKALVTDSLLKKKTIRPAPSSVG
jgi:hypothetical protein